MKILPNRQSKTDDLFFAIKMEIPKFDDGWVKARNDLSTKHTGMCVYVYVCMWVDKVGKKIDTGANVSQWL